MNLTLKPLLISLSLLTSAATAIAAPPSPASVDTLLTLSGTKTSLETATNSIETRLVQQMDAALTTAAKQNNQPITPAQKLALQKSSPQIAAVLKKELSWTALSPTIVQNYQTVLTQEDTDKLIALYKTPGYSQLAQKMLMLSTQTTLTLQNRIPTLMQKVEPIVQKALEEAGAAPSTLAPKQEPKPLPNTPIFNRP